MSTTTTGLTRTSSSSNINHNAPPPQTQLQPYTASPSPKPPTTITTSSTATTTTTLPKLPSTPQSQTKPTSSKPPPSNSTPTPGRWLHPRLPEILSRQNRTHFDQRNATTSLTNLALLITTFFIPAILRKISSTLQTDPNPKQAQQIPYLTPLLLLLQLFIAANVALPLLPLFRKEDKCEDIPLTPRQRNLLGLPPLGREATEKEKEQYVTPPRYQRATPQGSSGGSFGSRGSTPGMSGVPAAWRSASGSPIATPKSGGTLGAREGERRSSLGAGNERRRLSYNAATRSLSGSTRGSPLGFGEFDASTASASGFGGASGFGVGSVNTPTRSNHPSHPRASVGLNSKWLYERAGQRGERMFA